MLIYVDKKAIKRKKIKRYSLIISFIIILILNYSNLNTLLHTSNKSITNFTSLKIEHNFKDLSNEDISLLKLNDFKDEYKNKIINLILNPNITVEYKDKEIFLQNLTICTKTNKNKFCQLNNTYSFIKNIKELHKKIPPNNSIKQIYLLTPLEEIKNINEISNQNGVLFKFEERSSILLPDEIALINNKEIYSKLKTLSGINPDYNNAKMKLYKFKIVEINIDDNI